jgi:aldose 1-epimerase
MSRLRAIFTSAAWVLIAVGFMAGPVFASSIETKPFGTTADGQWVQQYVLTNDSGASVRMITYGATVTQLLVPDKNGALGDVVLGFDNLKQYEDQSPYFGATVGRVGNRIAHGIFSIDSVRYCLAVNNGPNHLHGGFKGLDKRIWQAESAMTTDGPSVRFTLLDPDGAEGYPGNVHITVIYSLTNSNALKIQYFATTDKATPINLTNHSYFNLKDGGKTNIVDHVMKIYGDHFTPVDETLIPTGELAAVQGTPFDFTTPKPIGQDIKSVGKTNGYDHNFVLTNQDGSLAKAIEMYEPQSGRLMEVWTTEPGVQMYTSNSFDGSLKGKDNVAYNQYAAVALECQHYPDSVNHPTFPNTILRPGETYRQITEYRFSVAAKQPW